MCGESRKHGFEWECQRATSGSTPNIPIIFITALGDTEDKVKGLSLGAVDYITKPFTITATMQKNHLPKPKISQSQSTIAISS
ncbi:MAG TPA: response regulator [Coleofasciculaceae cyanobacterium]